MEIFMLAKPRFFKICGSDWQKCAKIRQNKVNRPYIQNIFFSSKWTLVVVEVKLCIFLMQGTPIQFYDSRILQKLWPIF